MFILAGDIGGTKTLLRLCEAGDNGSSRTVHQQRYASGDYADFRDMVAEFLLLSEVVAALQSGPPRAACFAVAGPVDDNQARLTNLPWHLEAEAIAARFGIAQVQLINDFAGIGHAVPVLGEGDMVVLQAGAPEPQGVRAVLGAGTGLGQTLVIHDGEHYRVYPTEGGHTGFAPRDALQGELWTYLGSRFSRVSNEHLLSGRGLANIFEFLRAAGHGEPGAELRAALAVEDPAAAISKAALAQSDALAEKALDLFVRIYGARAGDLALNCLPRGGLYVAGGIAPKIIDALTTGAFMESFLDKAPMNKLLGSIPVRVVVNEQVGLIGAVEVAVRLARGSRGQST